MSNSTRVLLFCILMGLVPVSFTDCTGGCDCDCDESDHSIIIQSMRVDNLNISSTPFDTDTTQYIDFDSIVIRFFFDRIKTISKSASVPIFPFAQSANAYNPVKCDDCYCPPTKLLVLNPLYAIQLVSQTDTSYNDTVQLAKGKVINDLFQFRIVHDSSYYSISDSLYINKIGLSPYQPFDIELRSKPSHPVRLIFDIKIKLNDGTLFTFENQQLKVK